MRGVKVKVKLKYSILALIIFISMTWLSELSANEVKKYEIEANNTMNKANKLEFNTMYYALFNKKQDIDYYTFKTVEDGEVKIIIKDLPFSTQVRLLDEHGQQINAYDGNSEVKVIASDLKKGTYFVKITPSKTSEFDAYHYYSIRAIYDNGGQLTYTDAYEPNDIMKYAYKIESGMTYNGKFEEQQDIDYYTFTTDQDGETRIVIKDVPVSTQIRLLDQYGKQISAFIVANSSKLIEKDLKQGTYYIKVSPSKANEYDSNLSYGLKVTYKTGIHEYDFTTLEPNDIAYYAFNVDPNRSYYAKLEDEYDVDWYVFHVKNNTSYSITLSELPADYDLAVYNKFKEQIGKSNNTGIKDESIVKSSELEGTIYVAVYSHKKKYDINRTYNLKVNYEPAITVYLDDENMNLDMAPIVENGTTLVPMREIFEAMGASVEWNQYTNEVIGIKGTTSIKLILNSKTVYKNQKSFDLSTSPKIVRGTTFVPLRFISESLGANVEWNEESQRINIQTE